MFKQRSIKGVGTLILLTAITGLSSIMADSLELTVTSQHHECSTGSSTGGGC